VKNVSGRLLVGLRWWNKVRVDVSTLASMCVRSSNMKVNDDGSNEWMFESRQVLGPIPTLTALGRV
jgi:hypothetical protein